MTLSTGDDPFWKDEATVRLCCLSPDERFMHSLQMSSSRHFMIESRHRPLVEDPAFLDDSEAQNFFALVQTDLPDELQASLRTDPPIEMFALKPYGDQRERFPLKPINTQPEEESEEFSVFLCVYSRKNVFHLTLSSTNASARLLRHSAAPNATEGRIVAITEPFRRVLSGDSYSWPAVNVVRVRPAPTYEDGYAVLSPPGSLAMLTYNHETCTHALVLYHAGLLTQTGSPCLRTSDHCISTPFELRMEEVYDGSDSRIADFCFARSCELPLFSSMTVLFVRSSGEIMAASPILFHGAVIKNSMLQDGLEYLEGQLDCLTRRSSRWNQCRIAKQYLLDIFPSALTGPRFRTADLAPNAPPSAQWPVKAQGPMMCLTSDDGPQVCAIECVGNSGLVGLAIAMDQGQVDFAVVSPTAVLPRFTFESKEDSYVLDEALFSKSSTVEKVVLEVDKAETSAKPSNASLALIRDPVFDNLIHVSTQTAVFTISTYAIQNASQKILAGTGSNNKLKTTAWPCIKGTVLRGVFVSGDGHAGHAIVAQSASDGRVVCVSVPQAQAIHEIQSHISEPNDVLITVGMASSNAPDNALQVLESTTPLHEIIGSLIERIESGLASLSRIVGSETRMTDITHDKLAVLQRYQESCSESLVLPLLELKKETASRKENLQLIVKSQEQQLANLFRIHTSLEKQRSSLRQNLDVCEANATILMNRCASALATIKDMSLTITDAEWKFAQDIKRIENKCTKIQEALMSALDSKAVWNRDVLNVDIDPNLRENAEIMLKYSATALDQVRTRLSVDEELIQRLL